MQNGDRRTQNLLVGLLAKVEREAVDLLELGVVVELLPQRGELRLEFGHRVHAASSQTVVTHRAPGRTSFSQSLSGIRLW